MNKRYYVYILASRSRNLYTGVTGELKDRIMQHKLGVIVGFTRKYRVHRLVHLETYSDVRDAIAREKQIKRWRREKKVALIESRNPAWDDLAAEWFDEKQVPRLPRLLENNRRGRSG
ncbi:MAG: GIY-YIG nuclease family protein [Terriglobia bacterium]